MARFFSTRGTVARARPGPPVRPGSPVPYPSRDPVPVRAASCESHQPGHQIHYIHQGQALRSPAEHAGNVVVVGNRVVVVLPSGEQLDWRHHDPERLRSVLALFATSRIAYPRYHALRVGPYWFNCAPGVFTPCEPATAPSRS